LEKIAFGRECNKRIRSKGVIEDWKEFVDGDRGVFEQCEGTESDTRVEELA
jgi:hypothetical protein